MRHKEVHDIEAAIHRPHSLFPQVNLRGKKHGTVGLWPEKRKGMILT